MARDTTQGRRGVSLAKGPVAIIGLIGILYGISALIFGGHGFALHIPHGVAHGKKWIGLEVNGWSDLLFIAAGFALLLAAPLHWGAKSMSLLVGLVLIAAAIIAIIRKDGVFGIFAANHLTELVWAAAGVLLLILALLPRVGAREPSEDGHRQTDATSRRVRTEREPPVRSRRLVRRGRATETTEASDQHARWLQDAEPEDHPPSAGAQRIDNPESR